ncbi:MAG: thioredoxin domain-containing protein [Candidatus Binatia bacterium]
MFQRTLAIALIAFIVPATAGAQSANEVVATVGDVSVTRADLEKAVKAQLIEVDNQRYEILEEGLNNLVSEKLLDLEAKSQGKSLEAFQTELMSAPVEEPSAETIQKVYDENKEQLGGKSLDEVKGRIVEYLKNQGRAQKAQTLLTELRAKYPTSIKLSPPVVEVSDAGRESRGGDASAPVTIIGFSDYECPFCKKGEDVIAEVMKAYGTKVRYVHRDYPLPFHKNARRAAETARCAGEQGKFWEVHDAIFEAMGEGLSDEKIAEVATAAGTDKAKIDECLASGKMKTKVDEDMAAGGEVGVSGTPAFFVNGRMLSGAQPFDRFKSIIDAELAKSGSN